jgi:uncharacterized protein YbaR (Trm112 family)
MIDSEIVKIAVCPLCHGALRVEEEAGTRLRCAACGKRYRVEDGIPVLLAQQAE